MVLHRLLLTKSRTSPSMLSLSLFFPHKWLLGYYEMSYLYPLRQSYFFFFYRFKLGKLKKQFSLTLEFLLCCSTNSMWYFHLEFYFYLIFKILKLISIKDCFPQSVFSFNSLLTNFFTHLDTFVFLSWFNFLHPEANF